MSGELTRRSCQARRSGTTWAAHCPRQSNIQQRAFIRQIQPNPARGSQMTEIQSVILPFKSPWTKLKIGVPEHSR